MNDPVTHADPLRLAPERERVLFPEMATTLLYWVTRLHRALIARRVRHVFFLSREGQPLKQIFDLYCDRVGGDITSHYLEVSRRSTFLPSLGPLPEERFETLFRQYRFISMFEFLSSLGLEAHCDAIARELRIGHEQIRERMPDFPQSALFARLLASPTFLERYERRRLEQRNAFVSYLTQLAGGKIPSELTLVDVGWKGTIQDHLHSLLCRPGDSPVRSLSGFYVGLIHPGNIRPGNEKEGLLFSSLGTRTRKFGIFNENRSLFEVLLAANHGSVLGYEFDSGGRGRPVRDVFEEENMLARAVFPVQRHLIARIGTLIGEVAPTPSSESQSLDAVARAHARMVFRPSPVESAWFASIFHVENFGVFERSEFGVRSPQPSIIDRMAFLVALARRKAGGDLGFWPWHTIRQRAGTLPAAFYAAVRRMQP